MNKIIFSLISLLTISSGNAISAYKASPHKMVIQIILGSTRQNRTSDKIAHMLKQFADTRTDIITEIVDLRDYNLPFLNDAVPPASREKITDPVVKKWSEKIQKADGFIIVVPEYNAGYPGVLKNALDSLYKEWNNKPVAFVGYSGGPSGGTSAIAQLKTVAAAFEMVPVGTDITIAQAWKAFDAKGNLMEKSIEQKIHTMLNQLMNSRKPQ